MPPESTPALSTFSGAGADPRPAPQIPAAVRRAGLDVGELAISDPERNRWDAFGWFYCNVSCCRRKALRFWREIGTGRRNRYADCGTHTGSELDGFAQNLAAAVATWRAVAQDEADERDLTRPLTPQHPAESEYP